MLGYVQSCTSYTPLRLGLYQALKPIIKQATQQTKVPIKNEPEVHGHLQDIHFAIPYRMAVSPNFLPFRGMANVIIVPCIPLQLTSIQVLVATAPKGPWSSKETYNFLLQRRYIIRGMEKNIQVHIRIFVLNECFTRAIMREQN